MTSQFKTFIKFSVLVVLIIIANIFAARAELLEFVTIPSIFIFFISLFRYLMPRSTSQESGIGSGKAVSISLSNILATSTAVLSIGILLAFTLIEKIPLLDLGRTSSNVTAILFVALISVAFAFVPFIRLIKNFALSIRSRNDINGFRTAQTKISKNVVVVSLLISWLVLLYWYAAIVSFSSALGGI